MILLAPRNKILVKKYSTEDGTAQGALLSFNGKINDELIRKFKSNYCVEGEYIKNGGALSPQSMLTLIGSNTGALGMSGVMSGKLFMATADPSTLMKIGNGVGSAVLGTHGIATQAPFIAVNGAIMGVAAPLLAFQAISTIMIMNQFKGIHERLDHIEKSISRIIQRSEALYVGEIISALNRIEEIEHQFSICKRFTNDMIIRLAHIEDKVNPIFERYRFLYQSQRVDTGATTEDLRFKQNDAYFAIILSILDLRIELLQLGLAVQDNPVYLRHAAERLANKVDYYHSLWSDIGTNSRLVETVAEELTTIVDNMNWWKRIMPESLLGKRSERKKTETKANEFLSHAEEIKDTLNEDISSAIKIGKGIQNNLSTSLHTSLIYWRDELGEHSYYTSDLDVIPSTIRS